MSTLLPTDLQTTTDNSNNAISKMESYRVIPTPENYHLWFTHVGNYDLTLSKAVDRLIADKVSFDDEVSEKLYNKFFAKTDEKKIISETGESFKSEMTKIINILKEANTDTTDHSNNLAIQMDNLSDFEGSEDLKEIVKLVLTDVEKINSQSQKLEKQLEESSSKIEGLQSNLESARIESRTDALTKIGNRKYFDEKLSELIASAKEGEDGFCLIISDIDFFKKFNDTFGHQVGDQVLKVVAQVLKTGTSSLGMPYRFGGEEFVILVPNSILDEASTVAQTIKQSISTKSIKNKNTGQDFGKITMSFGIAQYMDGDSAASIIQRADAALYLAKDNGRNRVQDEREIRADEPPKKAAHA